MKSFVISLFALALIFPWSSARADRLYVMDTGGVVYNYNTANGNHNTFVSGLGDTLTMVLDENTNLYVTYQPEGAYEGGVLTVAPDKTVNKPAMSIGNASPYGLTVGPNNTIWVADTENGVIYPYNGRTFVGNLEPLALAFDTRSNLYATDYSGNIYKFTNTASGLSSMVNTFAAAPNGPPYALAFDGAGDLFVTFTTGIYEFTNHPSGLSSVRGTFNNSIHSPDSLAFDSNGDLFATGGGSNLFEFTNTPDGLSTEPTLFATVANASALAIVPSLPKLSVSATGANVTVSWQAQGFGWSFPWLWPSAWTLQHNNTLFTHWTNFSGTITTNSLVITATIPPSSAQDFFRLAHP